MCFKENEPTMKTPEQWLAESKPADKTKGALKLFLGYAPGVGKTFSMLSEAIRRHSRGEDVVIGIVETHGRKGIAELSSNGSGRDSGAAPGGRPGGRAGAYKYPR
jgi:two-component system, OmpR family, sensor histidine kinase KdpD